MGAGWCPPGILGIGIGGTPEKAMLMAKEPLMAPPTRIELKARGAKTKAENRVLSFTRRSTPFVSALRVWVA